MASEVLRLDKLLSHSGCGTRSEIKKLLKQKRITVNGKLATDGGMKIHPDQDEVVVDGQSVAYRKYVYIMLNKPQGVISATEDTRDRTVIDLLDATYSHIELFPVGRLDKDTEGLLLLTNDGKLAHQLLAPRKHVDKTYYADVAGMMTPADAEQFLQGVVLDDGYTTMPAKLEILEAHAEFSRIHLTIQEGKFHQVKRMVQAVGKRVLYLKRLRMGTLELDPTLEVGEYRELSEEELHLLQPIS